jgi:hypothetical protein
MAYVLVRNLPRTRTESAILVAALVATAAAVAVYGLYQGVVELPITRAYYLGHKLTVLRRLGIEPGSPAQALYEQRLLASNEPVATFALANSLAGFLVGPAVVCLAMGWEAFRDRKPRGTQLGALALAALPALAIVACLLLTKSRSAYLGLALGVAVLAGREFRRGAHWRVVLAAAGGLLVLGSLVAAGLAMGRLDREVLTEAGKSLRYRQEYWVGAWGVITESSQAFWLGHGPGNFGAPYLRHKLPWASEDILDPHNLFLDVWATAGARAVLALLAALGLAFWNLFGPGSAQPGDQGDLQTRDPPDRVGWLLACAGGGGWLMVLAVGDREHVGLSEGDFFFRWVILGLTWIMTILLGYPLWRRVNVTAAGLGAGALAVVVNLLAAGGIGISAVALMLWLLIALGLNLREDRPCSRLRNADGRLAAFALAACWAALLGIFVGAISPFWEAEEAIAEADAWMKQKPPQYARATAAFDRAIRADKYSARPCLGMAYLAYEEWRARGAKPADLRWKRVPILLKEAAAPPRNPDAWTLHRDRALISRSLLDQLGDGLEPAQSLILKANIVEGLRTATRLNPTAAILHAQLAESSARIGMIPDAATEAREALRLDQLTPHADRKLTASLRKRLESQLPGWENAAPPTPAVGLEPK